MNRKVYRYCLFIFSPLLAFMLVMVFTTVTQSSAAQVQLQGLPPVAVNGSITTDEDISTSVHLSAFDLDSQVLTFTIVTPPGSGSLSGNAPDLVYLPATNFFGEDSFTFIANDGEQDSNLATISITVKTVNDPPVANDDDYAINQDTTLTINAANGVLKNDTDPDNDPLTAVLMNGPAHGMLTDFGSKGSFTYEPNPGYRGLDSFTYIASDGNLTSNQATVSIQVLAVNHPPQAAADSYTTPEDTALSVGAPGVLGNDDDPDGDSLIAILASGPANGTLTFNEDGSFLYTPGPNYHGTDTFTYVAEDATAASAETSVTITVQSVNDTPKANDDSTTTDEDTAVSIDVLANDSDPDGWADLKPSSVKVTSGPGSGSTQVNSANGVIAFTPALNFNGPVLFIYQVCDYAGACDSAVVKVDVGSANDHPVAVDDSASTPEDQELVDFDVLANDTDPDGTADINRASLSITDQAKHGAAEVNQPGGTISYTPKSDYFGQDDLTYQICDMVGACDTARLRITIEPVNDAPVASIDSYTVIAGQVFSLVKPGVLANDEDIDSASLTAVLDQQPAHGTLALKADGSFTYTSGPGFTGYDSFKYHASDGDLSSAPVLVTLSVEDATPPVVKWVQPVEDGGTYDLKFGDYLLNVEATDNIAVAYVRFYRWDAVNNKFVEITILEGAPYQVTLNSGSINLRENQIFARAYDGAGNESERQYIWVLGYAHVFLPVIAK